MTTAEQTIANDRGVKHYMEDHPLISVALLTVVIFVILAVAVFAAVAIVG